MISYSGIPDTKCTNCPYRDRCIVLCHPDDELKDVCDLFEKYNQPAVAEKPIDGKALRKFMDRHRN